MLDEDHGTVPGVSSSNTTAGGIYTGTGIYTEIKRIIGILKSYTTRVGEGPFPTELGGLLSAKWCKGHSRADEEREYAFASINSENDFERGVALRTVGGEFGATTGRPRRCGWEDAAVANYARKVNGITEFCLTKLDTLDTMERIKICTGYELDGKRISYFPISQLEGVTPVYEEIEGWLKDTTSAKTFEELPRLAQEYVLRLEELSGSPIPTIGVGPKRDQTIVR
jgi:adenylosuccinate synthase